MEFEGLYLLCHLFIGIKGKLPRFYGFITTFWDMSQSFPWYFKVIVDFQFCESRMYFTVKYKYGVALALWHIVSGYQAEQYNKPNKPLKSSKLFRYRMHFDIQLFHLKLCDIISSLYLSFYIFWNI